MRKLTEKQKRFADYYIETGNATESYKRAGYKYANDNVAGVEAHKLLRNPKIRVYIDEKIKAKDKKRIATQDEVLEYYTRVMNGEEKDVVVTTDAMGEITEKKVSPDLTVRTKAADALGKRYGLFIEKTQYSGEITQNIKSEINLSNLSIEELKDLEAIVKKASNNKRD